MSSPSSPSEAGIENRFGALLTSVDQSGPASAAGLLSHDLVVRLDGNNVEEGRRILAEAAHPLVTVVDTMDAAAEKAAELAAA